MRPSWARSRVPADIERASTSRWDASSRVAERAAGRGVVTRPRELARGLGADAFGAERAGAALPGDASGLLIAALVLSRPSPLASVGHGLMRWSWLCATLLFLTRWRGVDADAAAA